MKSEEKYFLSYLGLLEAQMTWHVFGWSELTGPSGQGK